MTLEQFINKLQKYLKEHPEHKDMEIWNIDIDIAATTNNIQFEVKNGMLVISNGLFTY